MRGASVREHRASILVAALGSAFGVALLQIVGALDTAIRGDAVSAHSTVTIALALVAAVFIAIAVYVSSVVTTNTFATIIAGRTRTIALLRLIGSSASAQRRAVALEGLVVGLAGSVIGALAGTGVAFAVVQYAVSAGMLPEAGYRYTEPVVLLPAAVVVLSTWLASWVGSRRVLDVTPMQAVGSSQEASHEETLRHPLRHAAAIVLFVTGMGLLAAGILVGLVTVFGLLISLAGGILSFTGLVLGSQLIMPPALRLAGRMMGSGPAARLAAANAVRYPERSSRTTIGLVIGVTLVTMFAVAMESYREMIHRAQQAQPELYQGTDQVLAMTLAVFAVLIGFSALIAAVGMVNNLSLSVLQRQRELGLLRALGFTGGQARRMIVAEAAQMSVAAAGVGLILGVFYGWAGAQSLLGSVEGSGFVPPSVPWALLVTVAAAAALLTVVASVAPSRRATRITPVEALVFE